MRITRTRTSVIAVSAALTLGLAACSSNDPSTVSVPQSAASASATEAVVAQHNDADVTFIKDMTPHHVSALAMAQLAPTRAENAEVKALAARIVSEQDPELNRMKEMATAWGVSLDAPAPMSSGSGMSMDMGGDEATLTPLKGAAFDKAFLELMTAHHQGALPMAQAQLDGGENPQAKVLAEAIIKAQTAEIAEMKQLLAQL